MTKKKERKFFSTPRRKWRKILFSQDNSLVRSSRSLKIGLHGQLLIFFRLGCLSWTFYSTLLQLLHTAAHCCIIPANKWQHMKFHKCDLLINLNRVVHLGLTFRPLYSICCMLQHTISVCQLKLASFVYGNYIYIRTNAH